MDRLNPWRTGSALALTVALINILCMLVVYLFPQGTIEFVNSWTHGLDLAILRSDRPWTTGGLLYGEFSVALVGFIIGALYACCYNWVGKCCRQ